MNHNNARLYIRPDLSVSYMTAGVFAFIIFFMMMYGYFLQAAVRNAVAFDDFDVEIERLRSSVGELESAYVEVSATITLERARAMGFIEAEKGKFISRPSIGSGMVARHEI